MRKSPFRCIVTVIALLFSLGFKCQDKRVVDSLYLLVAKGNDTTQLMALNELSLIFSETDTQKGLELAFKSLKKAKILNSDKFLAYSFNRVGSVYDYKSMPDSAMLYYQNALSIFEKLKDRSGIASVYQNIGVLYYFQDEFAIALDNYQKALEIRLQTGEEKYISKIYNNIGATLRRLKKYDQAISYYQKALEIKLRQNDKTGIAGSYQNIAVAYEYKLDYNRALEFMKKAIEINSELKNYSDLSSNYSGITQLYIDMLDYKSARQYCQLAIEKAKQSEAPDKLFNAYEVSWVLDTLTGDYKSALHNLYEARKYKSKIFNKEKTSAIEKLRIIYETEKKDNEIKILNVENETKNKQKKQLYLIIGLISLLLIVSLIFYSRKRKDNVMLTTQKQEILDKTKQLQLQAEEIARHRSQMNPHFLFNALNSLQGLILNNDIDKSIVQLNSLSKLMRQTLNNSMQEFISVNEELVYLQSYIDFEQERFDRKLNFEVNVQKQIDMENTGIPPMLIQPLVENCLKHAGLNMVVNPKICVSIEKSNNNKLLICVEDNGMGRRSVKIDESRGLGILKNRISEINHKQKSAEFRNLTYTDLKDEKGNSLGTKCEFELPEIELF